MGTKDNDSLDIFDKVMGQGFLRALYPVYQKYREALLYLFFGGLTFFLSIGLYWLFAHPLSVEPLVANCISWILCVAFAYVTNRTWVFTHATQDKRGIVREVATFALGRLTTLVMEEAVLWIGISVMSINDVVVKLIAQLLVIVGNYIISKWLVFNRR